MNKGTSTGGAGGSLDHLGSTMRSRGAAVGESALRALFTPPRITREQALGGMERQAALTHLVASLEYLRRPENRREGGVNNWGLGREAVRYAHPAVRSVIEFVSRNSVTDCLLVVRAGAALVLLSPVRSRRLRFGADAAVVGTALLLSSRNMEGGDGSDQASFLAQGLATVARAAGSDDRIVDAALWAASLQSALSYVISGWAKLLGPTWRDGSALENILRTRSYGNRGAWKMARRFPTAARILSGGVLFLECTFPLAYLGRGRLAKSYVAGAAAFHSSIAGVMGLNRFLTAFTSLHPAVLYTTRARADTVGPDGSRSDTLLRVTGGVAVGAILAGLAGQRRNRRKVEAGHGDERWLYTSDGNRLAYRQRGLDGPGVPVYVFETGLLGVAEAWEWIADELAAEGTIVTYQRAGSGRSSALPYTAESMGDLAVHAAELVEAVGRERPVVLIGHSMGGYLALRTAERSLADIRAVILVDSSHPASLDRSPTTAGSAADVIPMSKTMSRSLRFGLGNLLSIDWVTSLPKHVQPAALAQYRDSRTWVAAAREWDAVLRDFAGKPALPQLDVPVLALTAQLTVERDDVQGELHRELAAVSPRGRHLVVPDTNHMSMLNDRRASRRVARAIIEFVRDSGRSGGSADVARIDDAQVAV